MKTGILFNFHKLVFVNELFPFPDDDHIGRYECQTKLFIQYKAQKSFLQYEIIFNEGPLFYNLKKSVFCSL